MKGLVLAALLAGVLAPKVAAEMPEVREYHQAHQAEILAELRSLLAIPNLASDGPNIRRNADALVAMLQRRGVGARQLVHGNAPPAVFGELQAPGAKRTIVFYAHYDGQPVVPSQWASDPWVPVLRDKPLDEGGREIPFPTASMKVNPEARIYARSASDDKAPIIALLAALDALKAARRRPAINVKFFFEGEEEAGSPHLREILEKHADLLKADLWILCDGPVHQSRQMQVYLGARGVMGLQMTVYGARRTLHSGHYGNWAPNPASILAEIIGGMRSSEGRILIDGFYEDVRALSESERRAIAAVPPVEEKLMDELAIAAPEPSSSLAERITLPALNVQGIRSGDVGREATNSIPTEAAVSIDFRLVPDQKPGRVRELVEAHLRRRGYQIVHQQPDLAIRRKVTKLVWLDWEEGYPAARTPLDLPISSSLITAIEHATGETVITMPTLGGSIPMYLFAELLDTPVIGVPIVNHDNNQHAANENLRLQNLWDGIEIFAAILSRM